MDIIISGNEKIIQLISVPSEEFSQIPDEAIQQIAAVLSQEETDIEA